MTRSDRLRSVRKQAHLSQAALAEHTGIDTSLISRFETGERDPSAQQWIDLARALGVSVDYLLNATAKPRFILRGAKAGDADESDDVRRVMLDAEQQIHFLQTSHDMVGQPVRRFAIRFDSADIGVQQMPDFVEELRTTLQLKQTVSLDQLKQAIRERHIHVFEWSMPLNLSGLSYRGGVTVIFINREHAVGRRLFTLAHELAHVLFHFEKDKDEAGIVSLYSRRGDAEEKQANEFAAELLMPSRAIDEMLRQPGLSIRTVEGLEALAQRFNVSRDAMFYRLAGRRAIAWSEKKRFFSAKPDAQPDLPRHRVARLDEQVSPEFLRMALELHDQEKISAGKLAEWTFASRHATEDYLSARFFEDQAYIV